MKFPTIAAVAGAVLCAATTVSSAVSLGGAPKPAFLYIGPKDDAGWNQSMDGARTELQSALQTTIPYVETGVDGGDAKTMAENFIKQGHNVVIGNSAKYAAVFKELAGKYGDVAFFNISDDLSATPRTPNFQSVYGRSYESQYLCGVVAGMSSKTANVGFVAPRPSPIVNWEINGFTLGVLRGKPDATVHVAFVDDGSPTQQRSAASALIDRGADVLGQGVDGPTPQIVAQERGIFATGRAVDLHELAPKSSLCASVWAWGRYLSSEIGKIATGNWQADPNSLLLGITQGGVDIACCSTDISHQTMAKLLDERDGIIISRKQVFAGPLTGIDGKERVPAADVLSDNGLRAMDWYVKGVVIDR